MRGLKKIISTLCLMFVCSAWAAFARDWPDDFQEVFDITMGNERLSFGIVGNDIACSVFFFDSYRDELYLVLCDSSEYSSLKDTAFKCKKLVKSVSNLQEYEQRNLYSKIIANITELANFSLQDYESTEFGFVKMSVYISSTLSTKYPAVEDVVLNIISNPKRSKTTSPSKNSEKLVVGQEWNSKRDVYDWYTSLDQINTNTDDEYPSSVRVQIILGYEKDDKVAATELAARRIEITDFLRRFFSEQTAIDLKPQNEENLRRNIRDQINDQILCDTTIKDVRFTVLDVVQQ